MVLARELDERMVALQREGRITQHASAAGEEAAIVGAGAAGMLDDDWLFLRPARGRCSTLAGDAPRRPGSPGFWLRGGRRQGAGRAWASVPEGRSRGKHESTGGYADTFTLWAWHGPRA